MWQTLERLTAEYLALGLEEVLDYEKFCMISIVWHSTKIEGCSLSETDTRVLLEHDLTAAGKPLRDHLMVKDHFTAFEWVQQQARTKAPISLPFLQQLGAKGEWRLVQVYVDKKYFPNYQKVPALLERLCVDLNGGLARVRSASEVLRLAADAHFHFVNIHPFADGNGRASRLLLNYIQLYHRQPLVKIFTEDRTQYLDALNAAEEQDDLDIFRDFVCAQQIKFLSAEIEKYERMNRE